MQRTSWVSRAGASHPAPDPHSSQLSRSCAVISSGPHTPAALSTQWSLEPRVLLFLLEAPSRQAHSISQSSSLLVAPPSFAAATLGAARKLLRWVEHAATVGRLLTGIVTYWHSVGGLRAFCRQARGGGLGGSCDKGGPAHGARLARTSIDVTDAPRITCGRSRASQSDAPYVVALVTASTAAERAPRRPSEATYDRARGDLVDRRLLTAVVQDKVEEDVESTKVT